MIRFDKNLNFFRSIPILFILASGFYFYPGWGNAEDASAPGVTVVETDLESGEMNQISADARDPAAQGKTPKIEVTFIENREIPLQADSTLSAPKPSLAQRDFFSPPGNPEETASGLSAPGSSDGLEEVVVENRLIIQLNATLKEMIEQNSELLDKNQGLDKELKSFTGQRRIDTNRLNSITVERDAYKKQAERILTIKERLEDNVAEFKDNQRKREEDLQSRITSLQNKIARQESMLAGVQLPLTAADGAAALPVNPVTDVGNKSRNVMAMLDRFSEESKQVQKDEGKIHYNMGNTFFHQGEYKRAVEEYKQAVELVPEDSSAHFNLAFVSGEYILDPKTALKHYKLYLQLNPAAQDSSLVKEKILAAELDLSSKVNSSLERDLTDYRRDMYEKNFGGVDQ